MIEMWFAKKRYCFIRPGNDASEQFSGGAGDVVVFSGVAELAAEARWPRLHRTRQRRKVRC